MAGIRATPPTFTPPPLPLGRYVQPVAPNGAVTSSALGNGTLRLVPFVLFHTTAIDRLGAEVMTAGDAGSVLRVGVYADSGAGLPGALVVDGGPIPADVVGVAEVTVAARLPAGLLWIGGVVQGVTTTAPALRAVGSYSPPVLLPLTAASSVPGASIGYSTAAVFGALPATSGATFGAPIGAAPRVHLRVAP